MMGKVFKSRSDLGKLQTIDDAMTSALEDLSRELQVQSLEAVRLLRDDQATQFKAVNDALARLEALAASGNNASIEVRTRLR